MKTLLKLTLAISAIAMLGSGSLRADSSEVFRMSNQAAAAAFAKGKVLPAPVRDVKCDTMTIQGGGRNGWVTVPCKHYASVRPDDCRRACANK